MFSTEKKKPKIKASFSIPHESNEILNRFSELTGVSKSEFISQVLDMTKPYLEQLILAIENDDIEAAKKVEEDFKKQLLT